ncbi:MAG: M20/M25/M40 family metallo-hydrolase [Candidatus Dojkabacteria bacterium]|nr:MAG: M20/M25/M40 family metallo-hydrolase [Candidatus Dojkabacteria bacterium]
MTPKEYFEQHKDRFYSELADFVRIKSISTDEQFKPEIRNAVEWLKTKLAEMGLDDVKEILPEDRPNGYPVVVGHKEFDPSLKTLLVYGHYDVQPPEPLEQWTSDPFEPEIRDGAMYGRGTTDNKGQLLTNLAGLEYYLKHGEEGKRRFNIKVFFEGEEEISGATTEVIVASKKFDKEVAADYVYISDGPWATFDAPSIEYASRGLAYFDLHIKNSDSDMHSGIYGNAVMNPANVASYIVYKLKDIKKNRVRVPGFYKTVRKPGEEEIDALNSVSPSWEQIRHETTARTVSPYIRKGKSFSALAVTGLRPSFDVHGMESGFTQWGGAKTIIPSKASVKFSFRLVPYQEPDHIAELVRKYIAKIMPKGIEWDLQFLNHAKPYITDPNDPEIKRLSVAFEKGFGKKSVLTATGGTIGIVNTFKEAYGATTLLANLGFPDDRLHAPNEKYNLSQFEGGYYTFLAFALED